MGNGQTQHEKLDKLLEITTGIRIKQGVIEERVNRAKEERTEMKEDIKTNSKMKRISNVWDGFNSFLIGLSIYFMKNK